MKTKSFIVKLSQQLHYPPLFLSTWLLYRLRLYITHCHSSPGDHSDCGDWCKFKDDPGRKFLSLPYGKPLTDPALRKALCTFMDQYIKKADQLSALGSSQANESFNNMVASKAPKSR